VTPKAAGSRHLRITVAYASPFRENVGVREETYETEGDSTTVKEVLALIVDKHSSMSKLVDTSSDEALRRQLVVAVNARLARLSDHVHDSERVSILLPVAGGSEE
jgi:molybdopterin converting factor small subunit